MEIAAGSDLQRAKTITGAVNFIVDRGKDKEKDTFLRKDARETGNIFSSPVSRAYLVRVD